MPETNDIIAHIQPAGARSWRVPIKSTRAIIGRSPDLDIVLDRSSVSRRHAEFHRDPIGRWWVRDLDSRGGTFVNGERITEHALQPGDVCTISHFEITLMEDSPTAESLGTVILAADDPGTRDSNVSVLTPEVPTSINVQHLSKLDELGRKLMTIDTPEGRLKHLCRYLIETDSPCLVALAARADVNDPKAPLDILAGPLKADSQHAIPDHISRTVVQAVLKNDAPVLADNVSNGGANIELSISPDTMMMAAAAVPIRGDGHSKDLIYVTLPCQYGSPEWLALVALAVKQYESCEAQWQAKKEAAAYAEVEAELRKAHQIQVGLVPESPDVPGMELRIGFQPCTFIGGDYVDVVPMADGRTLYIVADVTGHGLPAALVAQSLHSIIRMSPKWKIGFVDLLSGLNNQLVETLNASTFVTMVAVAMDTNTGEYDCINAGHPPVLIVDPDGTSRHMQHSENFPAGVFDQEMVTHSGRLEKGQLMFMYSDGLIEIQNDDGRLLGVDGLTEGVSDSYKIDPTGLLEVQAANLLEFLAKKDKGRMPDDDRSFLFARRR